MKLFHQIVTTINRLLFLVISSQVSLRLASYLTSPGSRPWLRADNKDWAEWRVAAISSPRIKSLLYEILPAANNSGCEHCISQSVWCGK